MPTSPPKTLSDSTTAPSAETIASIRWLRFGNLTYRLAMHYTRFLNASHASWFRLAGDIRYRDKCLDSCAEDLPAFALLFAPPAYERTLPGVDSLDIESLWDDRMLDPLHATTAELVEASIAEVAVLLGLEAVPYSRRLMARNALDDLTNPAFLWGDDVE